MPSTLSTLDAVKNWIAEIGGLDVVYILTNPVAFQLTPTEVKTLLGVNNIWADTGDVEVTYRADTKLYIDKKLAELAARISTL